MGWGCGGWGGGAEEGLQLHDRLINETVLLNSILFRARHLITNEAGSQCYTYYLGRLNAVILREQS